MTLRTYLEMLFAVLVLAIAALFITSSVFGQSQVNVAAERKAAIEACEAEGGIPVVIAGILNSRGIGCAQPLGD